MSGKVLSFDVKLAAVKSQAEPTAVPNGQRKWLIAGPLSPDDQFISCDLTDDSLVDAHIARGDYLLVKLGDDVRIGDLVIVTVRGGRQIGFYFREADGSLRLESANPSYPARHFAPGEFRIEGRVVRVERDLDPRYGCAVAPLESETDGPAVEPT